MSTKLLLPAAVVTVGLLAVLVPFITETIEITNARRDFSVHADHISQLSEKCSLQHPDQFFGCEDLHIVGDSIFTTCITDYGNRHKVFRSPTPFQPRQDDAPVGGDKLFRWDLSEDKVVELELRGFPGGVTGDDRAFHGFDINILPNGTLTLYVINQLFPSAVIDKFAHEPGSSYATHLARISTGISADAAIHANDVFSMPEHDADNAIFVTSACRSPPGSTMYKFEEKTRRPWGWVSFYSESKGWKRVFSGISNTNGITGDKDPKERKIYVSEIGRRAIRVLAPSEVLGAELKEIQSIPVKLMPDNPTISGQDLYVNGLARLGKLAEHVADPWAQAGTGKPDGPGMLVSRVNTKQLGGGFFGGGYTADPTVEEIIVDGYGALVNISTTALFKPYDVPEKSVAEDEDAEEEEISAEEIPAVKGDLFVTGITSRGILKCVDMQ